MYVVLLFGGFLPTVQLIRLNKHLNGQAQQFRELSDHIDGKRPFAVKYQAYGGFASNGRYQILIF